MGNGLKVLVAKLGVRWRGFSRKQDSGRQRERNETHRIDLKGQATPSDGEERELESQKMIKGAAGGLKKKSFSKLSTPMSSPQVIIITNVALESEAK